MEVCDWLTSNNSQSNEQPPQHHRNLQERKPNTNISGVNQYCELLLLKSI